MTVLGIPRIHNQESIDDKPASNPRVIGLRIIERRKKCHLR
jgi:hypothetical protein